MNQDFLLRMLQTSSVSGHEITLQKHVIEEMQSYDYNGWYSEWDSKYRELVAKHDMNFHLGTEYGEFLEWKANTPQEDLEEIYGLTEAKRLAEEMGGTLGSDPQ